MSEVFRGRILLKNTAEYPFHDSCTLLCLPKALPTSDYRIDTQIIYSDGEPGLVYSFAKAKNGFKIDYTGPASIVEVEYAVFL